MEVIVGADKGDERRRRRSWGGFDEFCDDVAIGDRDEGVEEGDKGRRRGLRLATLFELNLTTFLNRG